MGLTNMRVLIYTVMLSLLTLLFPLIGNGQSSVNDEAIKSYIERYSEIAVQEMMVYGIPASITLAQGIIESDAGRSDLARKANNHFGIKCHKDWTGQTITHDDETKNECFRKYDHPEESFRDHSYFLSQRERYKGLFILDIFDYKGWAKGLKAAGYATLPEYPEKLIRIIEKYSLSDYDKVSFRVSDKTIADNPTASPKARKYNLFAEGAGHRMVYLNNGLQFTILRNDDNIASLASAFHVSISKLRKWNDLRKDAPFAQGQMVYLEPKKKTGPTAFHTVKSGETMYTISQLNGIKLKLLYKRNHIKTGQKLVPGRKLLLR
jgi:hypothetical protein